MFSSRQEKWKTRCRLKSLMRFVAPDSVHLPPLHNRLHLVRFHDLLHSLQWSAARRLSVRVIDPQRRYSVSVVYQQHLS